MTATGEVRPQDPPQSPACPTESPGRNHSAAASPTTHPPQGDHPTQTRQPAARDRSSQASGSHARSGAGGDHAGHKNDPPAMRGHPRPPTVNRNKPQPKSQTSRQRPANLTRNMLLDSRKGVVIKLMIGTHAISQNPDRVMQLPRSVRPKVQQPRPGTGPHRMDSRQGGLSHRLHIGAIHRRGRQIGIMPPGATEQHRKPILHSLIEGRGERRRLRGRFVRFPYFVIARCRDVRAAPMSCG